MILPIYMGLGKSRDPTFFALEESRSQSAAAWNTCSARKVPLLLKPRAREALLQILEGTIGIVAEAALTRSRTQVAKNLTSPSRLRLNKKSVITLVVSGQRTSRLAVQSRGPRIQGGG